MKPIVLAPSAEGLYIHSDRFKTGHISVNLFLPLVAGQVSATALLPFLLRRACAPYPTMQALGRRLDGLYGAELSCEADKIGDVQVLRLTLSFIEDRFALNHEPIAAECAELLCSLLFEPLAQNGAFDQKLFDTEQRLFIELVQSEINNKRGYAINQLCRRMCAEEPFGLPKYGTPEEARALTPKQVYAAYLHAIKTAYIRVNVVGAAAPDAVFDRFAARLKNVERSEVTVPQSQPTAQSEPLEFTEPMAITQGKLVMGFTVDFPEQFAAAAIMADVFGGGPYSRLFNYVREKLSLCYYCACRPSRRKGLLLVDSGVDLQNVERARAEILRQLDVMKDGGFTDEELNASRQSYRNLLLSALDSQPTIDRYYADRVFDTSPPTIDEFADAVMTVTREQVIAVAGSVQLKAVYLLEPTGAAGEESDD